MDFAGAIKDGFKRYATFSGATTRRAFWYWQLFTLLVSLVTSFIDILSAVASLALFLPNLTTGIRRSRDAGFSAWFQLLWVAPFALFIWKSPELSQVLLSSPVDPATATDAELEALRVQLLPIITPGLIAALTVSVFFLITYLLPSKSAAQGNRLVRQ